MKNVRYMVIGLAILAALPAQAITTFTHIVVIVQENRTPDNLFYELCQPPVSAPCTDVSSPGEYDIKTDKPWSATMPITSSTIRLRWSRRTMNEATSRLRYNAN